MSSIQVKGPLNDGTVAVKNQSDLTRSRVQLKYLIIEADASVAALTLDQALTSALTAASSDSTVTKYGNVVRQDATARRLGPKKVEVTVTFGRSPAPPTPSGEIISLSTSTATVPVYRLPAVITQTGDPGCSSGPCTTPSFDSTSGLPSGDWADTAKLAGNANPVNASEPRAYAWQVPEVSVSIPARLTSAEFVALHASNGAMTKVGYWNETEFSWGQIDFGAETLKFNGCNAQWVSENGVFVYYARYEFSWRPNGWYQQVTVPQANGFLATQDNTISGLLVEFENLFPV